MVAFPLKAMEIDQSSFFFCLHGPTAKKGMVFDESIFSLY